MNALKTQRRTYNRLQKFGSTMVVRGKDDNGNVVRFKGLMIEVPSEPAFRYRKDYQDIPNRESSYFLVGIPAEAPRNDDGDPIDKDGNVLSTVDYPMPELTRVQYIRHMLPRGREFVTNEVLYNVLREIPLLVSDVTLYLLFMCDPK